MRRGLQAGGEECGEELLDDLDVRVALCPSRHWH
jgi:hypothetical protein